MADLTPYTPEWWIARLWYSLEERARRIGLYDDYYDGRHRLRFMTNQTRETFGNEFQGFADNFCELVVDAVEERLGIRGFRVAGSEAIDPEAKRIWEANDMDAQSSMVHTEALTNEEGYLIVWNDPDDPTTPIITAESPFEVIVEYAVSSRRKRVAALKRWIDDERKWRAVLYLPTEIWKYQSKDPIKEGETNAKPETPGFWAAWPQDPDGPVEPSPLPNPLGVVPVIPVTNRPRLGRSQCGTSELKAAIPIQDAINKTVFDSLIASEFVAYPQRYMVGVSVPKDENDQPIQPFKAGANRMWFIESDGTAAINPQIGQFPQADMLPYVARVEAFITHLAAITKTPKHYLIDVGGGTNLSGDTVKALEAPLISKARNRQKVFGVGWAETMAIALRLSQGGAYEPADADRIEIDWMDPETRTESQHIDALVELGSDPIRVPREQLWSDAGYSPEQIQRFLSMESGVISEGQAANFAKLINAGVDPASAMVAAGIKPMDMTDLVPVTLIEDPTKAKPKPVLPITPFGAPPTTGGPPPVPPNGNTSAGSV